jgi:hypothetical protein
VIVVQEQSSAAFHSERSKESFEVLETHKIPFCLALAPCNDGTIKTGSN